VVSLTVVSAASHLSFGDEDDEDWDTAPSDFDLNQRRASNLRKLQNAKSSLQTSSSQLHLLKKSGSDDMV